MLIRLCYASTREDHQDLLQDLSEILTKSRNFNGLNNICGVLYYAHNAFFQCLEGNEVVVKQLVEKIKKDTRHSNILCFEEKIIEKISFNKWSMKYVECHEKVDLFFKNKKIETFQPHLLKATDVEELNSLLLTLQDTKKDTVQQGYKNRGYHSYL